MGQVSRVRRGDSYWLVAGTAIDTGVGLGDVSQQFSRCLKQPHAGLMPKGLTLSVWPAAICHPAGPSRDGK